MSRTFDGNNANYLSISDDIGVSAFGCTIAFWVKITTLASAQPFQYKNATTGDTQLGSYTYSDGDFSTRRTQQGVTASVKTTATATANVWRPVICIYDTDGSIRIVALGQDVENPDTDTWVTNSSPVLYIGQRGQYNDNPITGKIAHFTVWDSVLGASDITAFQNGDNPSTINSANLTRYWALTDTSLTDSEASAVLTVNGTVTSDTGDNPSIDSATPFTGTTTTDNIPIIGQTSVVRAGPVHLEAVLVDKEGVTRNNLTGLKWAWFDAHPSTGATPTDVGTAETTDGSGNLYLPIPNATTPPGSTGWLVLSSSDESESFMTEMTVLNF